MKHIKKFNEGSTTDDADRFMSSELDKFKKENPSVFDDELDDTSDKVLNAVNDLIEYWSGDLIELSETKDELIFKEDELKTEYGTYKYELKITRID
jgi:hypothetical protein